MDEHEIHESHDIEKDYEFALDPHNPAWYCKTCNLTSCTMCPTGEGMDDDDLAVQCLGFSIFKGIKVTGDDEITRTVKRCRTGWF
jgi:hypothetical protein